MLVASAQHSLTKLRHSHYIMLPVVQVHVPRGNKASSQNRGLASHPHHTLLPRLGLFSERVLGRVSLLTVPLRGYCNGKIVNCLFLKTTIRTALS